MDKNIFGDILGGDKTIAANIIEKFYHSRISPSAGYDAADGTGLTGRSTRNRS